jgi:hypothetical protein
VWYLANASSPAVREAMRHGALGQMVTPNEGRRPLPHVPYGADNGCFSARYVGDRRWLAWLDSLPRSGCLFATAPDIVVDAEATLARSVPWLPVIASLGFPPALVAQDGLEHLDIPWESFSVLFLGGTTAWKLGHAAAHLAREAHRRGKTVHMGRVNSARRWIYAQVLGCRSVDGTFLAYAPDTNLRRLIRWTDQPDQRSWATLSRPRAA